MDSREKVAKSELTDSYRVFKWAKFFMLTQGIWPANPSNILFFVNFTLFTYQMITHYFDLHNVQHNIDEVFLNVHEHIAFMPLYIKLISMRLYIGKFGILLEEARKHYCAEDYTDEERKVFVARHKKSILLAKLLIGICAFTLTAYYLKPFLMQITSILDYVTSDSKNVTFNFILPYRYCKCYYQMKDVQTYFLFYLAQIPIYFSIIFNQCAGDCAMVALVFHLCARMAVLVVRIKNINTHSSRCSKEVAKVIKLHAELLRTGKLLEESFSFALLGYVACITVLICVIGYQLIVNLKNGEVAILLSLSTHFVLVVLVILGYCIAGQSLLTESDNVTDAFYNCKWYEMPPKKSKLIFFSILRSQQPLQLNGGKFAVLGYKAFASCIKAALGYLSVLRTVL